jgi:hypothetical protein
VLWWRIYSSVSVRFMLQLRGVVGGCVTVEVLLCVVNGFTMVKYISTLVPGVASLYTFATITRAVCTC